MWHLHILKEENPTDYTFKTIDELLEYVTLWEISAFSVRFKEED